MKKMLVIVGPTASGKTAQSLKIAQKFSGSLINADSRQVYKQLDIISGKDIPSNSPFKKLKILENTQYTIGSYEIDTIPLYLTDIVEPTYEFSIHDFLKVAPIVIDHVFSTNSFPIVVGGSGFYIKSLLDGVDTVAIPLDEDLRKQLENQSVSDLQKKLGGLDNAKFEEMNNSDKQNPRRLIRAIEIALHKRDQPVKKEDKIKLGEVRPLREFDVLQIGLKASRDIIKKRIDLRIDSRISIGAWKEAEDLFQNFSRLSEQVKSGNGYKQLFEYFEGTVDRKTATENWRKSEYLNAKKQMTWFKKDSRVEWFDIEEKGFENRIEDRVIQFLASK